MTCRVQVQILTKHHIWLTETGNRRKMEQSSNFRQWVVILNLQELVWVLKQKQAPMPTDEARNKRKVEDPSNLRCSLEIGTTCVSFLGESISSRAEGGSNSNLAEIGGGSAEQR
jgi:hypothetical protein